MTHSANDDAADKLHPSPNDPRPKITDFLPKYPSTITGPITSLTTEELHAFAARNMHLRGSMVCWKRDGGLDVVTQRYGRDNERFLHFRHNKEPHVVRLADVAWMICHDRPIPEGHAVSYCDGDFANTDRYNLWLTRKGG